MALFASNDILFWGFLLFASVFAFIAYMVIYTICQIVADVFRGPVARKRRRIRELEAEIVSLHNSIKFHQDCIRQHEMEIDKLKAEQEAL